MLVLQLVDDLVEVLRREDFGGFRLGTLPGVAYRRAAWPVVPVGTCAEADVRVGWRERAGVAGGGFDRAKDLTNQNYPTSNSSGVRTDEKPSFLAMSPLSFCISTLSHPVSFVFAPMASHTDSSWVMAAIG